VEEGGDEPTTRTTKRRGRRRTTTRTRTRTSRMLKRDELVREERT